MKKFNITVNGKSYAVEVEEVGGTQQAFTYAPIQKSQSSVATPLVQAQQPVMETSPTQKSPHTKQAGAVLGELMTAPMPGTILEIKVLEGQTVKTGQIVVILEAMKMENELAAPIDGTVKRIYTGKGESINAGDSILIID